MNELLFVAINTHTPAHDSEQRAHHTSAATVTQKYVIIKKIIRELQPENKTMMIVIITSVIIIGCRHYSFSFVSILN